MATKDITDLQVCQAVQAASDGYRAQGAAGHHRHLILSERTGQHPNVCWRALERADRRGLIDYGIGLHGAFLTDKGRALLAGNGT